MQCPIANQESAEILLDYCSRKLDPASTAILEEHIAVCPTCREFAHGQQAIWNALDTWESVPVTADFDRRLYQRIEKEVSWWDLLMRPFRPLLVRQGLPIAAAAALVIGAGALLDRPVTVTPNHVPETANVETIAPEQAEHALQEMEMLQEFNRLAYSESGKPRL